MCLNEVGSLMTNCRKQRRLLPVIELSRGRENLTVDSSHIDRSVIRLGLEHYNKELNR